MAKAMNSGRRTPTVSPYCANEERVMLVLGRAERSMTMAKLSEHLEISAEDLQATMRSLYQRHFLLISRGIGDLEDTYILTRPARAYARRSLFPEMRRELPIEALGPVDRRR